MTDDTTQSDDALATALGLVPANTAVVKRATRNAIVPLANTNDHMADDVEYALQNIHDVIQKTTTAIDQLMDISEQSQHPRSYEVLSQLLKQQADAAEQLLNIHKRRKDLNKIDAPANGTPQSQTNQTYIANAIFTGTNAELLDLIKGKSHHIIEHDDMRED